MSTWNMGQLPLILFLSLIDLAAYAYTPQPRWGQAAALINDALYVQGGMVDPFNSHSYTGAPITNDLLYLPLSSSFDVSSPPWQLLSDSSNSSQSQGPQVAWHTMSAYNISQMLIFGGFPSYNSDQVLPDRPDSAWVLDVLDRSNPIFTQEPPSWGNEPLRRMHHSAVTNRNGLVFIVGGEKADLSKIAHSDHYVFDVSGPSFTQLPSDNGPGGITGQQSIILPNGTMLVFGGYDQPNNQMVPFSTVWVLDTTASSYSWASWAVSTTNLPTPRRAFAAVLIDGGKILIQGGSDSDFSQTYNDGWMLDLTQNPLTWSPVSSLTQVGQRRDHFAVSYGSQVIFGFGYSTSGAASVTMQVYNPSDGSYSSSFTPPATPSVTQTIPISTETAGSGSGSGSNGGHSTGTPGSGDGGDGNGDGGTDGGGGGGDPQDPNNSNSNGRTTAIAVGTTLGVLAALVIGILVVYYVRRQGRIADEERRFMLLSEDLGGGGSPHLEEGLRSTHALGEKHDFGSMFKKFKFGSALTAVPAVGLAVIRRTPQRRDMLADEDTRNFSPTPWYNFRRGSSWSLRSAMRFKSRDSSTSSYVNLDNPPTPWNEKIDPFSDGAAVMRDGETGYIGAAAPGHGGIAMPSSNRSRRDVSYSSSRTDYSYGDPFADPFSDPYDDIEEVPRAPSSAAHRPYPRPSQPLTVDTLLPLSTRIHTLSPVTEASRGTMSQSDQSNLTPSISSHNTNSNEQGGTISPFDTLSGATSISSFNASPRPSSLIDSGNYQPMRRSNSWWTRFAHTGFLDRRASGGSSRRHNVVGAGGMPEIRDPNPPPRLVAIEESQHSASPDNESPKSNRSNSIKRALSRGGGSKVYRGGQHGKSLSSLRTADSDAIERMAGMDVVQRERTGSHGTRGSSAGMSMDSGHTADEMMWIPEDGIGKLVNRDVGTSLSVQSPVEMSNAEAVGLLDAQREEEENEEVGWRRSPLPFSKMTSTPPSISTPSSGASSSNSVTTRKSIAAGPSERRSRKISGNAVAARVRAFEQMSMDEASNSSSGSIPNSGGSHSPSPPRDARQGKKRTSVKYGLVPRQSLFVANPDGNHGQMGSGDSGVAS
ncbi:hypothetical protein K435DRAFT_848217 [Dendrothele bispora CBS 962.96]|uniref:Galactose oxidase n=1 Tax=Dendrothele bispora (strain CBS 962.96) TaxID=1314807 RepID=A0A4S8MVG3_DENBC|nr:hypothetical protein K435DRAFT_848217 [Dendrothele bispora CBS 962.96]